MIVSTGKNAVCYVADLNFLLPTLISASRVRRFLPKHTTDIFVFVIAGDDAKIREVRKFVEPFDLEIVHIDSAVIAGVDWSRVNKTHVPASAIGRFFIADLLPQSCRNILYLDGDTWAHQSPAALIEAHIPEGRIAAVDDIASFCANDRTSFGSFLRPYFRGLGIDVRKGYFNSGVIAVSRNTWRTIAGEGLDYLKNNIEICKFHDQSALNAVAGDRRIRLPLAWNFQTAYRYWNIEKDINPTIYHFAQAQKPWTGPVEPWAEMFPIYEKEAATFAPLALPVRRSSDQEIAAANAVSQRQHLKLRFVYPWRLWSRQRIARQLSKLSLPQ